MEASLLGAQPPAATLRQPGHHDADKQPSVDAPQQGHEKTEPRPLERLGRKTHRAGSLVVVAGIALAQLVWIALLAYAGFWIATRLSV
jgi:hypothetical protein